ncbi:hypothetical protein MPF_1790 [Methanohalophilus portucalensis FDF-1]|uniref:Uncharacterized protein n=1 Tax=Methanohalophilus portucalensis FDF-1 TaxID=523843 RepID=A0A1L9C2Q4_9EURY|nr:hypothetical protein MPF_1790 [Methanohalophilus portucalensis FDF-1]
MKGMRTGYSDFLYLRLNQNETNSFTAATNHPPIPSILSSFLMVVKSIAYMDHLKLFLVVNTNLYRIF